jgi:AmiR/NasT family two-component response regulator
MPLGGKILVASSAAAERKLITEILRWAGHTLSAETADIAHTLRRTRALFPDLVIIDSALDGNRGFKAAEIIIQDQLAAVLLLVDSDVFPQARNYHYLIRPVNHNSLVPALEAALYYWRRENKLKERIRKLAGYTFFLFHPHPAVTFQVMNLIGALPYTNSTLYTSIKVPFYFEHRGAHPWACI